MAEDCRGHLPVPLATLPKELLLATNLAAFQDEPSAVMVERLRPCLRTTLRIRQDGQLLHDLLHTQVVQYLRARCLRDEALLTWEGLQSSHQYPEE